MPEPQVTINGRILTPGQAMALRVAVLAYEFDLETEGLGVDEMGKALMLVGERWMPE